MNFINDKGLIRQLKTYGSSGPFDHCIIDNFFKKNVAIQLEKEFPSFNSEIWHEYNNAIEIKKTCNNWNVFPPLTYSIFSYLNSREFLKILEKNVFKKIKLYEDNGLNAGGWHIHKQGGKLNKHLDYNIHPKLNIQRKLNIIIYLNSSWKEEWKGHLGFWGNESIDYPGELKKSILPKFNRAVLFDTTQNSWHGLPEPIMCPKNQYRKSLAVYYLCEPERNAVNRGKALFYPSDDQKNDKEVLKLIKLRSQVKTAQKVWRKK